MGVLFRYEMKKLFSRRNVWAFLAFSVVFTLIQQTSTLRYAYYGGIAALREVYVAYEGQTATDALLERARSELADYIAVHPGDFALWDDDSAEDSGDAAEEQNVEDLYWCRKAYSRSAGVWEAYRTILASVTVESQREIAGRYEALLENGRFENGRALTSIERSQFERQLTLLEQSPVIRYAAGWADLLSPVNGYGGVIGYMFLFVLLAALAPVISGEWPARMAPILGCAAKRRQAMLSKLLAAGCLAAGMAAVIWSIPFIVTAAAYGLSGAALPACVSSRTYFGLDGGYGTDYMQLGVYTFSRSYGFLAAMSFLITLAAAAACSSVIVLASMRFRRPLTALPVGTGVLAALALPFIIVYPLHIHPPWTLGLQAAHLTPVCVILNTLLRSFASLEHPFSPALAALAAAGVAALAGGLVIRYGFSPGRV